MRRGGHDPVVENASSDRWLVCGLVAVAAYLLIALVVGGPQARPILYDGLVPLDPYRWVSLLPITWGSAPALAGVGSLPFTADGSSPGSIATGDGQAVAVFPKDAVAPQDGEPSMHVTITPLHPRRAPPMPANLRIDGNAYRIEAWYAASGRPVAVRRPVTILLSYPLHAEQILVRTEAEWTAIPTTAFPTSQKVYGESRTLGIFVAVSPPRPGPGFTSWWPYAAAAAGLAIVTAGALLRQRASRRGV